ncbi:MAG: putative porin [Bacteroidales bacterium]|nr:putative porin [Bacteroidales bacterium]
MRYVKSKYKLFLALLLLLAGLSNVGQAQVTRGGNRGGGGNNPRTSANPTFNNNSNDPFADNDSTQTANQGPEGIIYNRNEEPDSVLSKAVSAFASSFRAVKIYDIQHPKISPTERSLYDRVQQFDGNYYLDLGSLGHSQLSVAPFWDETDDMLSFMPTKAPLEFRIQYDPNDVYTNGLHQYRFYQTKRPYTLLGYNSSIHKDYQIQVVHTQNIRPRWNMALNYDLISRKGQYTNSGMGTHLLDITTNYYSKDARYQLQAALEYKSLRQDENGGVQNDATCWETSNRAGVPVNMYSASNQWKDFGLFVHQSYNTVQQTDKYKPVKQTVIDSSWVKLDSSETAQLKAQLAAERTAPKTGNGNDTITSNGQVYILPGDTTASIRRLQLTPNVTIVRYDTLTPITPRGFNTGVVGLDLQYKRERHNFYDAQATSWFYNYCTLDSTIYYDSTQHHVLSADIYWTNDAYMDYKFRNPLVVNVGVRPEYNRIVYLTQTIDYFSYNPFARAILSIKNWQLLADAETVIDGEENGDYRLSATLSYEGQHNAMFASVLVEEQSPDDIFYHHEGCYSWDFSTFERTRRQQVALRFQHQSHAAENAWNCDLDVRGSAMLLSNNIWLNSNMVPTQGDATGVLTQGVMTMHLQKGWFHCQLQEMVQHSSDNDVVRVPLLASKNSVYADLKVFKNALHLQTGFDLRYHTKYYADGWNPVLGAFYRQDNVEVGNFLIADFWITLQVKRASIYGRVSHFNAPLTKNPTYFSLPHYPMEDLGVYWGVTWNFFN